VRNAAMYRMIYAQENKTSAAIFTHNR